MAGCVATDDRLVPRSVGLPGSAVLATDVAPGIRSSQKHWSWLRSRNNGPGPRASAAMGASDDGRSSCVPIVCQVLGQLRCSVHFDPVPPLRRRGPWVGCHGLEQASGLLGRSRAAVVALHRGVSESCANTHADCRAENPSDGASNTALVRRRSGCSLIGRGRSGGDSPSKNPWGGIDVGGRGVARRNGAWGANGARGARRNGTVVFNPVGDTARGIRGAVVQVRL